MPSGHDFDPTDKKAVGKEADKIETLAQKRIDAPGTQLIDADKDHSLSKALADEWLSLNTTQRNAVADALVEKYDNAKWNKQPRPSIETKDQDGNVTALKFKISGFDVSSPLTEIVVTTDPVLIKSPGRETYTDKRDVAVLGNYADAMTFLDFADVMKIENK